MESSPIFTKTYDFMLWLIPTVGRFPKEQRFRLTARVENSLFRFQELLLRAVHSSERRMNLVEADLELEKLRSYLRLAQDLKLLTFDQYEYAARHTSEMGKLLGGWLKATPAAFKAADRGERPDTSRGLLEQ